MAIGRRSAVGRVATALWAVLCVLITQQAGATCDITAASTSKTHVAEAIALATAGQTVCIPAGSSNWGDDGVTVTVPITIRGASQSTTVITTSRYTSSSADLKPVFYFHTDPAGPGGQNRIEDMTLDGSFTGGLSCPIYQDEGYGAASKQLIVGRVKFRGYPDSTRCIRLRGQIRGLGYSLIFEDCTMPLGVFGYNNIATEWVDQTYLNTRAYGSADTFVLEDFEVYWTSAMLDWLATQNCNPGGSFVACDGSTSRYSFGWIEIGQSGRVVVRGGHWVYTLITGNMGLFDTHGFQSWRLRAGVQEIVGQVGTMVAEFYGNRIEAFPGSEALAIRGGWNLIHNNAFTTAVGNAEIHMKQYGFEDEALATACISLGEANCQNGCMNNVLASVGGTVFQGELTNTFTFNNLRNGSALPMVRNQNGCPNPEDTDWANYNASFDGTSGIGRGTGDPPSTCTPPAAYWKASTATPTTDLSVITAGTFYQCTAPNTWTPRTLLAYPDSRRSDAPSPTPTPSPSHNGFFGLP